MRRIALPSVWPKPRSSGWMRNSATPVASSRLETSTIVGRTSPRRSIVCGISDLKILETVRPGDHGPATLCPAPDARQTRTGGRVPTEPQRGKKGSECGEGEPSSGTPIPIPARGSLLGVQLDYQLLLSGDRNVRARRALEHATTERLAIHGEPGERGTTSSLLQRGRDERELA